MIDDVWNSRRQSTKKRKKKELKVYCMAAAELLKKIMPALVPSMFYSDWSCWSLCPTVHNLDLVLLVTLLSSQLQPNSFYANRQFFFVSLTRSQPEHISKEDGYRLVRELEHTASQLEFRRRSPPLTAGMRRTLCHTTVVLLLKLLLLLLIGRATSIWPLKYLQFFPKNWFKFLQFTQEGLKEKLLHTSMFHVLRKVPLPSRMSTIELFFPILHR